MMHSLYVFGATAFAKVLGVLVTVIGGYLWFCRLEARHSTDNAPRIPMMVCAVHGTFPKSAALDLGMGGPLDVQKEDGRTVREAFLYCPMCYENQMKRLSRES